MMIRYIKTASIIFKSLADFTPSSSCATLTEQAKRIQEYKNKFNSLTERSNMDNSNDVFNNNKFGNNFNFKGRSACAYP